MGRAYRNTVTDEIVIAYAGTQFESVPDWTEGNLPGAVGDRLGGQILNAARTYLDLIARPDVDASKISFTGHSLGGGLASLMAVFFNHRATVFDPAPFRLSADSGAVVNELKHQLGLLGYSIGSDFQGYQPGAVLSLFPVMVGLQASPTRLARQSQIHMVRVAEEALSQPFDVAAGLIGGTTAVLGPLAGSIGRFFGSETVLDPRATAAEDWGIPRMYVDLHSMTLLAAFLASPAFLQAAREQSALLPAIFRSPLNRFDANDATNRRFLELMVQRQENREKALDVLARDADLVKTTGLTADVLVARAVLAATVAGHYKQGLDRVSAGGAPFQSFLVSLPGGLSFDLRRARAQDIGDVRQMLSQHVNSLRYRAGLTDPAWITDDKDGWFLQSGATSLNAEGLSDVGNVMVGWARADRLIGGNASDLLLGDAGSDVLVGGGGVDTLVGGPDNDTLDGGDDAAPDLLLGGSGVDTYVIRSGDTIRDPDRTGILKDKDGRLIAGAFEKSGAQYVWVSDPNVTATKNSPLTINLPGGGSVVIEDAKDGGFGIDLIDVAADPAPTLTRVGDLELLDGDAGTEGIQPVPDPQIPENSLRDSGVQSPNRADTFYGRDVDAEGDLIDTRGGDDTVYARRGADWVIAGAGRDKVWADQGDDLVEAGPDADIVSGGAGKDRLYGDSRIDLAAAIAAGAGVGTGQRGDWLTGGAGDDIVIGGAGNDALFGGEGEDLLIGGGGDDVLNGDDDYLATSFDWTITRDAPPLFDAVYTPVDILTPAPYAGGADTIYAGAGNDFASGLFGDDVIYGEAGEDVLSGDDGNDTLIGGADNDRITGDYGALVYSTGQAVVQGDDFLDGGAGDDWLQGEGGADLIFGGEGSDQLYGDADYLAAAQHGADYLDGGAGIDYLFGHGGDDTLLGGTEGDFLWGDAGADLLEGGAGEDYLEGGSGADTLYGGTETDSLFGNAGQDLLDGGDGDDLLNAGEDADTLIGGPGADTLIGGAGDDTYFANLAEGDRIIDDEGDNRIVLLGTPNSTGIIAGAATVSGQSGVLLKSDTAATTGIFVQGGSTLLEASNPTYEFADGTAITHSVLMQTAFTEALTLTGTSVGDALKGYAGADLIQGLDGDDWLSGGSADDVLEGGAGDDELIGGAGADILRGGLGDDTYTVDSADTIE
jgi:Ca2+-binding RTX toxin-like protein